MPTKILVVLAIVGHVLAYQTHRLVWLVVSGAGGGVLFFLGMYVFDSEGVIYLGLVAMLLASVTDLARRVRVRRRLKLEANPE